jgi:hypothetical protein
MTLDTHCSDCGPVRVDASAVRLVVGAPGRPARSTWSSCRVGYRCPGCGSGRWAPRFPAAAVLLLAAAGASLVDAPADGRTVPGQRAV